MTEVYSVTIPDAIHADSVEGSSYPHSPLSVQGEGISFLSELLVAPGLWLHPSLLITSVKDPQIGSKITGPRNYNVNMSPAKPLLDFYSGCGLLPGICMFSVLIQPQLAGSSSRLVT